jgi:hypothetical protein
VIVMAAAAYAFPGAACHVRVFTGQFQPGSPQLRVSALEAVAGLLIESVFIAMLTQGFFAR